MSFNKTFTFNTVFEIEDNDVDVGVLFLKNNNLFTLEYQKKALKYNPIVLNSNLRVKHENIIMANNNNSSNGNLSVSVSWLVGHAGHASLPTVTAASANYRNLGSFFGGSILGAFPLSHSCLYTNTASVHSNLSKSLYNCNLYDNMHRYI